MNIHMIGIGGAGMSGIAEVLARRGHNVTGSDLKESPYTRRLREAGITVYIGHAPEQVGDADRVVISTAIPKTNPELLQARRSERANAPGKLHPPRIVVQQVFDTVAKCTRADLGV